MDYLTLLQKARIKCRMSGSGPVAVTNQNAEYSRLLLWINEGWLEIQRMRTDWAFMRGSATCPTVQGQSTYTATDFGLTDLGEWALNYQNGDTFRNYVTASGMGSEVFMDVWDYDDWRDAFQYGALRTSYTRPQVVCKTPANAIAVGPVAEAGYTLLGDYYKVPSEMVLAADVPSLPAQYHWALIYKTMMLYGVSEAAPEVYDEGKDSYDRIMREVISTQTRRMRMPGALC